MGWGFGLQPYQNCSIVKQKGKKWPVLGLNFKEPKTFVETLQDHIIVVPCKKRQGTSFGTTLWHHFQRCCAHFPLLMQIISPGYFFCGSKTFLKPIYSTLSKNSEMTTFTSLKILTYLECRCFFEARLFLHRGTLICLQTRNSSVFCTFEVQPVFATFHYMTLPLF